MYCHRERIVVQKVCRCEEEGRIGGEGRGSVEGCASVNVRVWKEEKKAKSTRWESRNTLGVFGHCFLSKCQKKSVTSMWAKFNHALFSIHFIQPISQSHLFEPTKQTPPKGSIANTSLQNGVCHAVP